MLESVSERKEAARERFKAYRANLPEEEISSKSEKIWDRLKRLYDFVSAQEVAFYVNKKGSGEVQTRDMIISSMNRGKSISLPFVDGSDLKLSRVDDVASDCEIGSFDIMEPKEDCRVPISVDELDLIIVPGLAFDPGGQRLGYGKGYYDGLLSNAPSDTYSIGLAYESQISDEVPYDGGDVPVDKVVTEDKVFSNLNGCSDF